MIKVLHGADFHLDSAFSSLSPEGAAQRRREQRFALEQLTKICRDEACDIVLLAGDLFDSAQVYRDTLEALQQFFASCPAEIFIAPGNHDYIRAGSPYLTENWGENVHIFTKGEVECVHLPKLNCDVYGAAFTAMEMPSLLECFHVADEDAINLMVLHGDLQPNSVYNWMTPSQIAESGLDYLALGHTHEGEQGKYGKTTYAWPGCLMGRGFDECGAKGVLLAQVSKEECMAEFLPLDNRRYEILQVEVGEDVLASIRATLPADTQKDCYRILLRGEADAPDIVALEQTLSSEFFSLSIRDHTVPKQDLWAACGEDTLRGHFLRELKEQYDTGAEDQRRIVAKAAKLTLALMDGREVFL